MKLYTSYWAQVRNFPRNLVGLNTTVWPPRWRPMGKDKNGVLVIDCPPLKPGAECSDLCNGPDDCRYNESHNCLFLRTYYHQLKQIEFDHFIYQLQKLHDDICTGENLEDVDFAIIVFEKYDSPCSERWSIKKWFKEHNIEVQEWQLDNNQSQQNRVLWMLLKKHMKMKLPVLFNGKM